MPIILTERFTTEGDIILTPPDGATGFIAEGVGGGGNAGVWISPISPKSGGGGDYALKAYTLPSSSPISAHVGVSIAGTNTSTFTQGDDTWIGGPNGDPDCIMLAQGGRHEAAWSPTSSIGDVVIRGGKGKTNNLDFGPGVSGGGAAGSNGVGGDSDPTTGIGGVGNGGLTNGGAHAQNAGDGQSATLSETALGGGGGGGSAAAINNGIGGDGGIPGGGGGIGTDFNFNGFGGGGARGELLIHWTGPVAPNVKTSQLPRLIAYRTGIPAQQRQTAWTFVLDGHRFYVLPLGPEGDWAYDMTTQEWCQLQTQGFPGMNFTHGVMWGLRIMGGDALYPYLYELDPTEPFDENWREVNHIVTGGIATRARSMIGVANFTLTASVSEDSAIDHALSLAFSDDNGVTWSKEFDLPLTDVSTQKLIWNALGSFTAPGRVFRLTDFSGPIRLDGADVVLTIGTGADSGIESDGQKS